MTAIRDLYAPAAPGSLMRAIRIGTPGRWRLSRRDCELYSVQIVSSGAWGRACVRDGRGRKLWEQPSTFTGSFWLSAGADSGLVAELYALNDSDALSFTINWREPDREML